MAKFQMKGPEVDAIQWKGDQQDAIDFLGHKLTVHMHIERRRKPGIPLTIPQEKLTEDQVTYEEPYKGAVLIDTNEGQHICIVGDWIIKDDDGKIHLRNDQQFKSAFGEVK